MRKLLGSTLQRNVVQELLDRPRVVSVVLVKFHTSVNMSKNCKSNSILFSLTTALEEAPVLCGELSCIYANDCNAEAAGFNATTECCPAPRPEIPCSKSIQKRTTLQTCFL